MKQEITAALDLLISYVQRYGSLKDESIEQFRGELETVLLNRYQGHWYPGKFIEIVRSLEFISLSFRQTNQGTSVSFT